jgi:formylglycine-generating enzyme required for sulfatase activity
MKGKFPATYAAVIGTALIALCLTSDQIGRANQNATADPPRQSSPRRKPQKRSNVGTTKCGSKDDVGNSFHTSIGMELVKIPSGHLPEMGSDYYDTDERPAHPVTFKEEFYIGKYEVTQAQWQQLMDGNPSTHKGNCLPVENVSWDAAQKFIHQLNMLTDGYKYRLPTEAEWEYACRAGTPTEFAFGNPLTKHKANFSAHSTVPESGEATKPVGSFQSNAFHLHDMHGNVAEWCEDWFHQNYKGAPRDGSAWLSGDELTERVVRGGSYKDQAHFCRSAFRFKFRPDRASDTIGFRVVAVEVRR